MVNSEPNHHESDIPDYSDWDALKKLEWNIAFALKNHGGDFTKAPIPLESHTRGDCIHSGE
jgi:hypothetical protein